MRSFVRSAKFCLIGASLLLVAACASVTRPQGVTEADIPSGASKFATAYTVQVFELISDVTDKTDPADINNYKTIAQKQLIEKLSPENLEILSETADAPLKMILTIKVLRWNPIFGGAVFAKATVSTPAGKELYSTEGQTLLNFNNQLDSRIGLRQTIDYIAPAIIEGIRPKKAAAS